VVGGAGGGVGDPRGRRGSQCGLFHAGLAVATGLSAIAAAVAVGGVAAAAVAAAIAAADVATAADVAAVAHGRSRQGPP